MFAVAMIGAAVSVHPIFGAYNCPLSIALAAGTFLLFKKMKISNAIPLTLAPSMFSVYLLHFYGNEMVGMGKMSTIVRTIPLGDMFMLVKVAAASICVFVLCLALDLPRRIFVRFFKIKGEFLDKIYDVLISKISQCILNISKDSCNV